MGPAATPPLAPSGAELMNTQGNIERERSKAARQVFVDCKLCYSAFRTKSGIINSL